jgi:hypothetical protein
MWKYGSDIAIKCCTRQAKKRPGSLNGAGPESPVLYQAGRYAENPAVGIWILAQSKKVVCTLTHKFLMLFRTIQQLHIYMSWNVFLALAYTGWAFCYKRKP